MRKKIIALAILAQAVTFGFGSAQAAKSEIKQAIESGAAALQAGAYKSAVEQFTKALAAKKLDAKTTAVTLLNRGLAQQQLGNLVEALADYDRALQERQLPPKTRAVALYNRGLAHRKLYRTTLAIEDFTNALLLNPKFPQAYNSRANVLRELGYYTTAIDDYEAAVRYKHPQLHIPLYGQALSHAAVRNLAAAKQSLQKALRVQPNYKPAKKLLARITTVPRQEKTAEPPTLVANNKNNERLNVDTKNNTTTIVAKNNLPWAPSAQPTVTASVVPVKNTQNNKPEEVLIKDNTTAENLIARAPITPLDNTNVIATPTAAQPDMVAQNLVSDKDREDPDLRETTLPGKTVVYVPEAQSVARADTTALTTASVTPAAEPKQDVAEPVQKPEGYLIQLSAQTDPEVAQNLWNKLAEKHSDILGDLTPYIIKVEIDGKGTIYRVRAGGFDGRSEGSSLCSRLKSRRVSCYVTVAQK